MVRVKICGITTPQDGQAAARAGADAIGLNFVAGPRRIEADTAGAVLEALPPSCVPVALVDVGAGRVPQDVAVLLDRCRVSVLQLYGDVASDVLVRLRSDGFRPIIVQQVKPVGFPLNVEQALSDLGPAVPAALLLDSFCEKQLGGTGKTADWRQIAAARASGAMSSWPPLVLAGGLNPSNVAEAVRTVQPWAVDVSSGVERVPGEKDASLMAAFVAAAKAPCPGDQSEVPDSFGSL